MSIWLLGPLPFIVKGLEHNKALIICHSKPPNLNSVTMSALLLVHCYFSKWQQYFTISMNSKQVDLP